MNIRKNVGPPKAHRHFNQHKKTAPAGISQSSGGMSLQQSIDSNNRGNASVPKLPAHNDLRTRQPGNGKPYGTIPTKQNHPKYNYQLD